MRSSDNSSFPFDVVAYALAKQAATGSSSSSSSSDSSTDTSEIEAQIAALQTDVEAAQSDIENLQTTSNTISESVTTAQEDISDLQTTVSGLSSNVETAQSDIENLQAAVETDSARIDALEELNETGTWTPTTTDDIITISSNSSYYSVSGNSCTATTQFVVSDEVTDKSFVIYGLPFTAQSKAAIAVYAVGDTNVYRGVVSKGTSNFTIAGDVALTSKTLCITANYITQ